MKKEIEAGIFTMLIVLATIAIYNSLLKSYMPTSVRNVIGLG